jgi:hypothetical protein
MSGRTTQLKYAGAGKCQRCGKKPPSSDTLCRHCLQSHNAATAARKAALLKAGRCVWCGGKNPSSFRACDDCRERYNAARRARA